MMSRRLIVRSPIFEKLRSLCLPPVECWRGARPSHAAKSRPSRNVSMGGASAMMAVAAMGPMPVIGHQTTSYLVLLRAPRNLTIKHRYPLVQLGQQVDHKLEHRERRFW